MSSTEVLRTEHSWIQKNPDVCGGDACIRNTRVPVWALGVQGVWTAFLTLTGSYGQLLDYVIFAALIFYALTMISLFVLRRKRPEMERPYRAFGYPLIPGLYMLACVAIAVILLFAKPQYSFAGLFIVLLGIPVYYLWRSRGGPGRADRPM